MNIIFLPDVNSGFKAYLHQHGDFPYLDEHRGFTAFTISPGMHTDIILSTERLEYLELGTRRLCWHNFEHNRYLKASSIMPA